MIFKISDRVKEIEDVSIPQPIGIPTGDQICAYWPLIKLALTFVMIFTGKKGDDKIKIIIEWGDNICSKGK